MSLPKARNARFLLLVAVLAACSDSSGPETLKLDGTWTYNSSNLSGSGVSCSLISITMTIRQTGATFTGNTTSGRLVCSGIDPVDLRDFTIASGTLQQSSVSFDFDTPDFHHVGSVTGNTMTGSVVLKSGTLTLAGQFTAVKLTP